MMELGGVEEWNGGVSLELVVSRSRSFVLALSSSLLRSRSLASLRLRLPAYPTSSQLQVL